MQNTDTGKELVSFRFEKGLKSKLAALALATGRSQTFLVEEALRQYCDLQSWQVAAIQQGLDDADAGKLTSHEKVKKKWERKLERLVDAKR